MFKLFEHEILEMPELNQEKLDAFEKVYNENEGQSFLADNGDTLYFYKEAPHMVQRLAAVVSGNKFYQYGLVSPYIINNSGASIEEVHSNSEYSKFIKVRKPEPAIVEVMVPHEELLGDNFDHIGATYKKVAEGEDNIGKYYEYYNENLNIKLLVRVGQEPNSNNEIDSKKAEYDIMGVKFLETDDPEYNARLKRYAQLTMNRNYITHTDDKNRNWKAVLIMRNLSVIPNDLQTNVLIDVLGIFLNTEDLTLLESKLLESESTSENGFDLIGLQKSAEESAKNFIDTRK